MHRSGTRISLILLVAATLHNAYCLYTAEDDVILLTPDNFEEEVTKGSAGVYFVEFYAPWCGHCKKLTPEWKKAATALKGIVKVGAVNADKHKDLAKQHKVRGYPTIKIFIAGQDSPADYKGGRTAKDIVESAMSQTAELAKSRLGGDEPAEAEKPVENKPKEESHSGFEAQEVEQLTDANFEETVINSEDAWLIAFYAPWCGHCKRLAPDWAKAAGELKGKARLGAVEATAQQDLKKRFKIRGFPTIKYFPAGKKDGDWAEVSIKYEGGRKASEIVTWVTEKIAGKPADDAAAEDKPKQDRANADEL